MAFRLLVIALIGGIGLRLRQLYTRFEVAEQSMAPTLNPGDYLIADARIERLRRGDIVVFSHPDDAGFWLVKRVVGVPGDEIVVHEGSVTRNGEHIDDERTPGTGRWTVAPGELFVLGDNRAHSAGDSRSLGPISIGLIEGMVRYRYWPLGAVGSL